jgi:hypothetical protein
MCWLVLSTSTCQDLFLHRWIRSVDNSTEARMVEKIMSASLFWLRVNSKISAPLIHGVSSARLV